MKSVFLIIGTRPEAIKMAPVYRALKETPGLSIQLISTGQHRELLAQAMNTFGLKADVDLEVMKPGQSLSELTCSILQGLEAVFRDRKPDLVLAHGDTTTCFGAALSCFYHRVPMAHVEAGLRTYQLDCPFPEEFNRQGVAKLAGFHFAPNLKAKENLLQEGVSTSNICVTGTTAIDAIRAIRGIQAQGLEEHSFKSQRNLSLITLHRRENGNERLSGMLTGLREAAKLNPEMTFVYPVHPSPNVRHAAHEILGSVANVHLTEPMEYREFVGLLTRSKVVITDSGGIQEEAAYLGKRVLLLRDHTERSNGLSDGGVSLVGTHPEAIISAVTDALKAPMRTLAPLNPGESPSLRIAQEVRRRLA